MLRVFFALIIFSPSSLYSMYRSYGTYNLPGTVSSGELGDLENSFEFSSSPSSSGSPYTYIPSPALSRPLDAPVALASPRLDRELNQWVIHELIQQNKDLYKKLKATRKKWYVGFAGFLSSMVPLAIVSAELYGKAHCEE